MLLRRPAKSATLTPELQVKWKKVYYFARRISALEPWQSFQETDRFVYSDPQNRIKYYFSFLNQTTKQRAIACYLDESAYFKAAGYLFGSNWKDEPVRYLQNALIGLWGNKSDLTPENYSIAKQLNERGRMENAWLYFEKYTEGYFPTALSEEDVDRLGEALGQLFNMLNALKEEGLTNEFANKKQLVRTYDAARDRYSHAFATPDKPIAASRNPLVIPDSPQLQTIRRTPTKQFTVSMDWSYSAAPAKKSEHYPFVLVAVPQNSSPLSMSIEPNASKEKLFYDVFDKIIAKNGKPREIKVCDDELWYYVEAMCRAVGIKATKTKRLPAIERAKKRISDKS